MQMSSFFVLVVFIIPHHYSVEVVFSFILFLYA